MIPIDPFLPSCDEEAKEDGWEFFNSGLYRRVFLHPERQNVVLKIVDEGYGQELNEKECLLWEKYADTAFGFSLVPVVSRHHEFTSLLMIRMPVAPESPDGKFDEDLVNEKSWRTTAAKCRSTVFFLRSFEAESLDDLHPGNWGWIMDDYGDQIPGRILDYAAY